MLWEKFKKLFLLGGASDPASGQSIQKMVSLNGLNRRKNLRISYPHLGAVGPFPRVFFKGDEVNIANISVGGVLIIDDNLKFGDQVGEVIQLEFRWPEIQSLVRSRIVGAHGEKRHIQFVDFSAPAFLRISQLVKPAYLGQRFHVVRNESGALDALEMWIGPTGESLVFLNSPAFAELTIGGEKVLFFRDKPTAYAKTSQPVPMRTLEDLFIMIANFPKPTPSVKRIVEFVEKELRASQQRGTGTNG